MPGQGRPARDETGWRAGDAGCRGGDVGHRPLDAAPPTGGARPRGAGQQPAAAGVLAALARVAVGSVERLSGAVRLKQMIFLHNTCILVGLGLEYAVPYLCNPLDPPMLKCVILCMLDMRLSASAFLGMSEDQCSISVLSSVGQVPKVLCLECQ